jgi:hypothetical protein
MRKIFISIIACNILFSPFFVTAETIKINNNSINSLNTLDDVPTWQNGNVWEYNIEYEGELGEALSFNWAFDDLSFTIENDAGSIYSMSLNGVVIGEMSIYEIQLISGTLKDTTITGTLEVDKSNNGLKELDALISGKVAFFGIPLKTFSLDIDISFTPAYNSIDFPLNIGKEWTIITSQIRGSADLSFLDNPIIINDVVGGYDAECIDIETKTVEAGTFESYKILSNGDITEFYYSEEAGNIIKAYGEVDQIININLKSTNYGSEHGAPEKPSKPQGPSSGTPGNSYTYSTSAVDNEGDEIFYMFDWGDGSNSGWKGPYPSGQTVSQSKTWNSRGTFSVRVQAKDTDDHKSKWSDPLNLQMPSYKLMNMVVSSILIRLTKKLPIINEFITFY